MYELQNYERHHNLPVGHWQELREQAEEFRFARALRDDKRSRRSSGRVRWSWRLLVGRREQPRQAFRT